MLRYGGKAHRKGDLFGDTGSMANNAKRFLNSMFGEDVKNVLLQHKSWLAGTVLEQFAKCKLDEMRYPHCGGQSRGANTCNTLIVFMVGGVTYEEAKEVTAFAKQEPSQQAQLHQMAGQALGTLGNAANQPL